MELVYPFVLFIGIPLLVILIILKLKKKETYKQGKKIANTEYTKNLDYYKQILRKYKILTITIKTICVISIFISIVLLARPAKVQTSESKKYNRDIILCMDVSTSVVELDENLVAEMKETVKKLKGERFGISIFNTSSSMIVPLTDDYEYVLDALDKLEKSLKSYNDFNIDNPITAHSYTEAGTLVGNAQRGSSIIGDGLASAIFSFPNLEEDRTRVIIFSTDNDDASINGPIVTVPKAGQIAKDRGILVYALCPELTTDKDKQELRQAVETTGGSLYTETNSETVSSIVDKIEKTKKTEIQGTKETKRLDKPEIPFIILCVSICILFILNKKVKL